MTKSNKIALLLVAALVVAMGIIELGPLFRNAVAVTNNTSKSEVAPIVSQRGVASPSGRELVQTSATENQSDMRTRAAVLQQFKDMRECVLISGAKKSMPNYEDLAKLDPGQREQLEKTQQMISEKQGQCERSGDGLADGRIYRAALAAADLGDSEAATCYVFAGFDVPETVSNDRAQLSEYKRNATRLVAEGIHRGDWAMVDLLEQANSSRGASGWIGMLRGENADFETLKLVMLARLGAAPSITAPSVMKQIDAQIAYYSNNLSALQNRQANIWATAIYQQYFRNSPRYTRNEPICGFIN